VKEVAGVTEVHEAGGGRGDTPPPPSDPEAAKYITLPGPARRYVNSWFVGHPDPFEPLRYGHDYELGIEVGPQPRVGTLTQDDIGFKEPPFSEQETMEVVVAIVTEDFEVLDKPAKRMLLPRDMTKKSPTVNFKVRPIKNNVDAHINVLFYYRNNLFQESVVGARVRVLEEATEVRPTAFFPTADRLPTSPVHGPRDVNLQIVRREGSYRFILFYDFGREDFDIMWCNLPVNQPKLENLIQGMRSDLISVVKKQGTLRDGQPGPIFYDGEPEEDPLRERRLPRLHRVDDKLYSEVLKVLADAGSNMFVNLFFSGVGSRKESEKTERIGQRLRELSRGRGLKIQILSNEFFLPWNLIYDGDGEDGECRPSGFWGFKHVLEELPGDVYEEAEPDVVIDVEGGNFTVGMNVSHTAIPKVLVDPQLNEVRGLGPSVRVLERSSETEVLRAIQGRLEQGRLEYFYCHAGTKGDPQQNFDYSYIGLTNSDKGLTLRTIKSEAVGARFQGRPVVFLNACESAQMDGRFYDGFVPKFLMMGARAVVGTDCEVPSLFGAHFGSGFLKAYLGGDPVGEALLKQRQYLLDEYQNPLGLIYRVFGDADVRLAQPLF
ncbi:MAG: CHAT domain-containing protein, partial [Acidobacteria bacterium]|nr:CHAT domain-containing protein [Acidobacteriota bacterium]